MIQITRLKSVSEVLSSMLMRNLMPYALLSIVQLSDLCNSNRYLSKQL
jgi:hypothetical protein